MGWTCFCHYQPVSKIQPIEWKHTDSSVKKQLREKHSVKKAMLAVFWGTKEAVIIDFLEKGITTNCASTFLLLRRYFNLFIKWPSCIFICFWLLYLVLDISALYFRIELKEEKFNRETRTLLNSLLLTE